MSTEKEPSRRGLAGMDPDRRQQIARAGGRAVHEQGRGHQWTEAEGRQAGSLGGTATATRHPDHHRENGQLGGYTRGIRYLSRFECYLVSWLGAGKAAWQRTAGGPVWLSDQVGEIGDHRSFHAEAKRLLDRRLLALQIDTDRQIYHLTDGGRITAGLLEKRKTP